MTEAEKTPQASDSTSGSASTPNSSQQIVLSQITIEEFQRMALRVGIVVSAEDHPKADRLLVLRVDIGEATPRQVVAGIKNFYQPTDLVGKQVVLVANMKPAMLRGIESQGMVLAASHGDSLVLISPERTSSPGAIVK